MGKDYNIVFVKLLDNPFSILTIVVVKSIRMTTFVK